MAIPSSPVILYPTSEECRIVAEHRRRGNIYRVDDRLMTPVFHHNDHFSEVQE